MVTLEIETEESLKDLKSKSLWQEAALIFTVRQVTVSVAQPVKAVEGTTEET